MVDKENFSKDINVPRKEPIMIDGVDVSECKYYLCNTHKNCGVGLVDCEGKDCMFKQLARKTQLSIKQSKELIRLRKELQESTVKNRNLKQECDELISEKDFYLQKIEVLDQECEELKKQFETSEEWRIKAEGLNEKFELKNTRYRKALEEIEDICNVADRYELEELQETIFNIIYKVKGEE